MLEWNHRQAMKLLRSGILCVHRKARHGSYGVVDEIEIRQLGKFADAQDDHGLHCENRLRGVLAVMQLMSAEALDRLAISSSVNSMLKASSSASITYMCFRESHSSIESRELSGPSS